MSNFTRKQVGAAMDSGIKTLTRERTLVDSIIARCPNGWWLGSSNDFTGGWGGGAIWAADGNISGDNAAFRLTRQRQLATNTADLKNAAGVSIGGGLVQGAWPLANGDFLFYVLGVSANAGRGYLYLAKRKSTTLGTGSYSVGANAAAYDNQAAVLDIGNRSGVHPAGIRLLHQRSICVAKTAAGAERIYLGEYNVASGRVTGSTNDQVRIWQSADGGATWTVLIEFNTNGSQQTRHAHGIVQDPLTRQIYILLGDDPVSGIIRWDGESAAPPANTPIGDFNRFAGWSALFRGDASNDFYRAGDIVFVGDCGGYLTDHASNQGNVPTTQFWASTALSRAGGLIATRGPQADLSSYRDPLIGLAVPGAGAFWFSMWSSAWSGTRGFDVWSSRDLVTWDRIGEIPDVGNPAATTGVIWNVFVADGQIFVTVLNGATKIVDHAESFGGTVVFNAHAPFSGIAGTL